ncbi:MAG TPA: hypothetical protein VMV55_04315 [Methanoregula sp.]|nr:hypothetical protein [Methanoregula sp.]
MTSLVKDAFSEWTHGLDTRGSMISIFEHIRDIPYSPGIPVSDPKTSMEQFLVAGKGSCAPKHYLLAEMFRRLNLSVVYATIAFSWNDPDLHYPPGLRKQAIALPIAHHLACRVQIGCRWILVDATWDRPLAKGGFPINDHWDGYSEMKWAVKPLKFPVRTAFCSELKNEPCREKGEAELCPVDGEKDHWDGEDQVRYYREKVAVRTPDQVKRMAQFYREFDEWLADVRHEHV